MIQVEYLSRHDSFLFYFLCIFYADTHSGDIFFIKIDLGAIISKKTDEKIKKHTSLNQMCSRYVEYCEGRVAVQQTSIEGSESKNIQRDVSTKAII